MDDGQGSSGTPFRQALEHPSALCRGYTVAGLNPPSVAQSHLEYLSQRRATAYFNTSINFSAIESIYAAHENDTLVTFDLDAIDQASAPGVSAPATAGLSPHIWLFAAYKAGVLDGALDRCCRIVSGAGCRWPDGTASGPNGMGVFARSGGA